MEPAVPERLSTSSSPDQGLMGELLVIDPIGMGRQYRADDACLSPALSQFLLGVGATSFFSRRHHNHPSNQSPFSPPTFISAQTDTPQSQPSWRCRTRASARSSPPPDMAPGGMTMMEPITIGQALPKATEMTRDEAIRSTFEGSATAVSIHAFIMVLVLRGRKHAERDFVLASPTIDTQG